MRSKAYCLIHKHIVKYKDVELHFVTQMACVDDELWLSYLFPITFSGTAGKYTLSYTIIEFLEFNKYTEGYYQTK